ncbi:hypothetical protein COOONC_17525 [Cooperia oncophora]
MTKYEQFRGRSPDRICWQFSTTSIQRNFDRLKEEQRGDAKSCNLQNTSVAHLDVTIVPAWVSAAPVGSSFAKGGRMATHYREWDDAKQMWHYSVEVKKVSGKGTTSSFIKKLYIGS